MPNLFSLVSSFAPLFAPPDFNSLPLKNSESSEPWALYDQNLSGLCSRSMQNGDQPAGRYWGQLDGSNRYASAEEHCDFALGWYFWCAESEMYPQKYPSIPPAECAIENGDF